jgi:hypothetical protein
MVERSPRTVQNDLRALVNDFDAPLAFDHANNGLRCTPSSRPKLASHKLSYAPGISPFSDTLPLASDS